MLKKGFKTTLNHFEIKNKAKQNKNHHKINKQMAISTNRTIVLASPFLIILINIIVALTIGPVLGKWVFVPIILVEWALFMFFIMRYGGNESIKRWLQKPEGSWGWGILTLLIGLSPIGVFLAFYDTLFHWTVWLPWILLALLNPWLEEFYWRGLLMDYTKNWKTWMTILFTSVLFSLNHAVFGIYSVINSGYEVVTFTFIMGIVWGLTYHKTKSLRWCIFCHFLIDFFNLSAAAFLDLFEKMY